MRAGHAGQVQPLNWVAFLGAVAVVLYIALFVAPRGSTLAQLDDAALELLSDAHIDAAERRWLVLFPVAPKTAPLTELSLAARGRFEVPLVMGSLQSCRKVLLAVHGRGTAFSSGVVGHMLQGLATARDVAVVLPQAPNLEWFQLDGSSREPEKLAGWAESLAFVIDVLRAVRSLGKPVVVMGFSQGGAVALAAALGQPRPVEAVVCASGYLIRCDVQRAALSTRFFFIHSPRDPAVPYSWAKRSLDTLQPLALEAKIISPSVEGHTVMSDETVNVLNNVLD